MSKSKDNKINTMVKSYLCGANRPFSANDVFNNMNSIDNKLSKTAITKALDELSSKQLIKEKINGKQKLYFADQNTFTDLNEQTIKQMDQQLEELNKEFNHLRDETKQKESRLSSFKNSLSLEEIGVQSNELKKDINGLKTKLETINSKVKDLDPKQNQKLKTEREKLVNEWKKRKRMTTSMIDMILEGYPKPKRVLIEEIGIETDEELKVSVPDI